MEIDRITFPLMAIFDEDFKKNKGLSHITDLILLTIKSLVPSEEYVSVEIDYTRYKEEINLWRYYRHGENSSLLNILEKFDSNIYWKDMDDTLYYRLIPIILVNKDFKYIRDEVIKNILFTTGNIEALIEGLLISKLIYYLIINNRDIIDGIKEEIIHLSQVDFLEKYKMFFRVPYEEYPGNFSVDFERNKIYAINALNTVFPNKFKILENCIKTLNGKESKDTVFKRIIDFFKNPSKDHSFQLDRYYFQLGQYICNLRNGRIDLHKLKIEKYHLPDVFEFKEGDVFYHSLLNKSQVVKRHEIDGKVIIQLKTKSGTYKFIKD
ncbi:hypothetical protein [Tepidimicrobium xylanilyticum]|uniref:hypothetical protein n=1 Tax=Tepidimicrobium xylanilyticum TaxID=1123352 RepID=UPI00264F195D|nr:hypothetical protein [Tepidimicrobium xylanilyticum]GMG96901.1 hypothetical protein EN5CB1_17270 [Tepidimicrobium xylanilyticum]